MLTTLSTRISQLSIDTKRQIFSCLSLLIPLLTLLILSLMLLPSPSTPSDPYTNYIQSYQKQYSTHQQKYRRFIFYQTYSQIIFHNKNQLEASYVKGINQFTDLTKTQFQELFHMVTLIASKKNYIEIADFQYDTYDWTPFLNPIKNQHEFDVGHVFAATALLEFYLNRRNPDNSTWISLSQQQILDCCAECGIGQQPYKSLKHIQQNGISSSKSYPYKSSLWNPEPLPCLTQSVTKPYHPKFTYNRIKTCLSLAQQISKSPVIVGIDARDMKDYFNGIFYQCQSTRTHYALLVGKGTGYWKLRNSWGKRWGEQGYIRIKLGNTCAICSHGYALDYSQQTQNNT